MPADPGANLGASKLPTTGQDIGHVQPSFDSAKRYNTLVVRANMRISLRLGDIEKLFKHPPNTALGRMERMQVLGLFYFPLNHARARVAFDGVPAETTGTDPAPAFPGAWEYFKTKILNSVDDAAADAEIQRLLREWIVDTGALPQPADDPAAPTRANFAKIRIPGGYSFMDSWQGPKGLNLNQDPRPAYSDSTLGTNSYTVETRFRTDNPILGKIPLIALVEKRDPATAQWVPMANAHVYFQLQPTYDLPAFDPAVSVVAQINRPPIRNTTVGPPLASPGGPRVIIDRELNPTGGRAQQATDPQRGNARHDRGGLQGQGSLTAGTDVSSIVFSTTLPLPGFNGTPPSTRTDLPQPHPPPFPVARNAAAGSRHLHAVKAETNSMGEAGVIFTPSRVGGDRYRIKAYVGPTSMSGAGSDGTGIAAVSVETGTLVVWRSLRISRIIRQPIGAPDASLKAELTDPFYAWLNTDATYPATTDVGYLRKLNIIGPAGTSIPAALPAVDFSFMFNPATQAANPPTAFDSLPVTWAKAFVEVEVDRAAAGTIPETLTQADWQAAREQARRDARQGQIDRGMDLDLDVMMNMDASSTVNVNNAVTHLPLRTWVAYNNWTGPIDPAAGFFGNGNNTDANVGILVKSYMFPGFLRRLSNNGFMPGLTIISGGYGASYSLHYTVAVGTNSGWSLEYRGGFVWAGAPFYSTTVASPPVPTASRPPWSGYSFTSNTCHELGHVMFRLHGPGNDPGMSAGGGNSVAVHDPINDSICVMSYMTCEGDFCAHCLMAFGGWDITNV